MLRSGRRLQQVRPEVPRNKIFCRSSPSDVLPGNKDKRLPVAAPLKGSSSFPFLPRRQLLGTASGARRGHAVNAAARGTSSLTHATEPRWTPKSHCGDSGPRGSHLRDGGLGGTGPEVLPGQLREGCQKWPWRRTCHRESLHRTQGRIKIREPGVRFQAAEKKGKPKAQGSSRVMWRERGKSGCFGKNRKTRASLSTRPSGSAGAACGGAGVTRASPSGRLSEGGRSLLCPPSSSSCGCNPGTGTVLQVPLLAVWLLYTGAVASESR